METFEINVMLKDGSLTTFEVKTDRDQNKYDVLQDGQAVATFSYSEDGNWNVLENPSNIDPDLQQRIENQLNGYQL